MTYSAASADAARETRVFLEALSAGKPEELYLLLWTLEDKRSHWFRDVDSAIQFVFECNLDVYVGVGMSGQDRGPWSRGESVDVTGLFGLWADVDMKSEAHPKDTLPTTIEDALKVLPAELPPSFIVFTGNGVQAWWLFREPYVFESDVEHREAERLSRRWQLLLQLNAAEHGFSYDRLFDLARILRVPGSLNGKDPVSPKLVRIHSQTDHRYNPSDLAEFLDDLGIPDPEEQAGPASAWKEVIGEDGLSLNPNATVPEEQLAQYLETDKRFEKTWLRHREDLKDQSQSGYDMALANFGCARRLPLQLIVDMMIHHRRIHGQRPRTRLDYFARTITKAAKAFDCTRMETISEESEQANSSGPPKLDHAGSTKPDSAIARALLCKQISDLIGVTVLRIVKVTGREPTYRVELEGSKVVFSSVADLVGQRKFRLKIASAVDHLIPQMKPQRWDRFVQMMLSALTVVDGGDEVKLEGEARMYVRRYLSDTPFIDAAAEQSSQTEDKPAVADGSIVIRSHDLQQYINKTWNQNRTLNEVTAMLSALGAISDRLKGTKLRDQSRWALPVTDFPPEKYTIMRGDVPNAA
jgi:hypothetical protein